MIRPILLVTELYARGEELLKRKVLISISIFLILTIGSFLLHQTYQRYSYDQEINNVHNIHTLGEYEIEVLSRETFKPREYIKIR